MFKNKYKYNPSDLDIDYERAYIKIKNIQEGIYSCGQKRGFITVSKKMNETSIMWTSQRTHHNIADDSGYRNAVQVDFREDNIPYVFESAITMHPVTENGKQKDRILFMINRVEHYYDTRYPKKEVGFFASIINAFK